MTENAMSIKPVIVGTDVQSIENGITWLVQQQPNYEFYTISNSCNLDTMKMTKCEIQKISQIITSSITDYDQIKLTIDHDNIVVYPHLGSA